MSEPQFIPSAAPHSVEVAEGSHLAKSKSANVGTEVRQNIHDHSTHVEEIELDSSHVVITRSTATSDHLVKVPRSENIERASKSNITSAQAATNPSVKTDNKRSSALDRPVYDTEMQEMNFPARMIHLKQENDVVRAQLEDLQSLMGDGTNESQ